MIKTVEDFLKLYDIRNQNVVIGFSSGPDSCALALIVNELKEKFNLNIILAYFNHGWRVEEAKKEEEFTKNFAKKLNCEFFIDKAPKNLKKTEEFARLKRYEFFEKTAKKYNSKVVFLAHNKNDNIETLVYRLIKGTSTIGLMSIPSKRDIYYRPLLSTSKEEILNFLDKNNQNYMLDSSNSDEKYKRNLIRNKILPKFAEINPNYFDSIENLIKNSIATRKIVDNYIKEIENKIISDGKINHQSYTALDIEIRLEILNNFLYDKLKYRNRANLIKLDSFILNNENSKTSLNKDEFLVVKNNKIYLRKANSKISKNTVNIDKEGIFEFENYIVQIKKVKSIPTTFPKDNENICYLSLDFPLEIRHRENGDKFSPYGLKQGSIKLKDYLINRKIEQDKKDSLILLSKNKEICWIAGLKISEKFKANSENCYEVKLAQKCK